MNREMPLPPGWYVIASARELRTKKPNSLRRFGMDLVVWKSATHGWLAQIDRCPHRSAKLSLGQISQDRITCPFHGFEFDGKGECVFAPELDRSLPGLKLQSWSLIESKGFLWLPWKAPTGEIPWFEELADQRFGTSEMRIDWPTHFTRCVENQLDYTHLSFVHKTTIGRGLDPKRPVEWRLSQESLKVLMGAAGGFIELKFPNIWQLRITENYSQFLAFAPVDESKTRLYLRTYLRTPLGSAVSSWLAKLIDPVNRLVLKQDQNVVLSQEPRNVVEAVDEHLLPADKAIAAFRSWLTQ